MSIIFQERESESPYVQTVTHGYTASAGSTVRPAEAHWHMVIVKLEGETRLLAVGPWSSAGIASWGEGAEIVWIKFRLGTFMPHLPVNKLINNETLLPGAASNRFWLKGAAWQFPDHEDAETFVNQLVREDILASDPVVSAALGDHLPEMPSRTV
ncbi:MAG: AraC family transcriptional regulator, partial [Anaerolineae bacterium]|nr:AraC family transcriptional regulator [Anaerolineae bacterium]